jgi:hypothetical protein
MSTKVPLVGVEGLWAALRSLDREAQAQLRDAATAAADDIATQAQARGAGVSRLYARYVGPSIRARRDRVPVVAMGRKGVAGETMYGAEFGGRGRPTTQQFLPHLGQTGYALWPVIRQELPSIMDRYADALYDAALASARRAG